MIKQLLLTTAIFTSFLSQSQVTSGLVANYSFNNGNANDEAGTNNGIVNGATLTADRFGNANKAYSFDGNDYIDCGNGTSIQNLTTAYSISAWFQRSTIANQYEVITAKWNNTTLSEHFFLATNGTHVAWASAGPGNNGTSDPSTFNVSDWVHVVFTWASNGVHQVYFNSTLTTNSALSSHTVSVSTPVNFLIGAQSPSYRLFHGVIDDVKIYDRVLTGAEVTTLFNEPNPATVGVIENTLDKNSASVFPNPSNGEFMIKSQNADVVNLINELGQVIETIELNGNNNFSYKVNQLQNGIYFLVGRSIKQKVIIAH